jgi:hypothetical protein
MKRSAIFFIVATFLVCSVNIFAAETQNADKPGSSASGIKTPKITLFSSMANYFSGFNKPFKRPGNKQGFWNATADWMRGINKE